MLKNLAFMLTMLCLLWQNLALQAQIPKVKQGSIVRIDNFASQYVQARNIDVWLPQDYSPRKRYAVLYMHDGQMLFDSTLTWNKQTWAVGETMQKLLNENQIRQTIVVGIWNNGQMRRAEYFPQKALDFLPKAQKDSVIAQQNDKGEAIFVGGMQADNYLKFLVLELKPYIDKKFATYPQRKHTFVAGSSMGGLISLYALCEYPQVFEAAACLSTHWIGTFVGLHQADTNPIPQAIAQYVAQKLPKPQAKNRIYFDYGTATLDALYPPYQKNIDALMQQKGYIEGKNWLTKAFVGEEHTENAWRKRLATPLLFLLKK